MRLEETTIPGPDGFLLLRHCLQASHIRL